MYNFVIKFFQFLLPIFGKAVTRAVIEEVVKFAYDEKKAPRDISLRKATANVGRAIREADEALSASKREAAEAISRDKSTWPFKHDGVGYHDVIMVAFDIQGRTAQDVHEWLHEQMPQAGVIQPARHGDVYIDAWWVANDERYDGSDCDSAVFVRMGDQESARNVLRINGFI